MKFQLPSFQIYSVVCQHFQIPVKISSLLTYQHASLYVLYFFYRNQQLSEVKVKRQMSIMRREQKIVNLESKYVYH